MFSGLMLSQEYFYYYTGDSIPLELNTRFIYISANITKELPNVNNTRHIYLDTIDEWHLNRVQNIPNIQVRHNTIIDFENNF